MAIGLLTGLLLIDWPVALAAAGLFGGVYALLATNTRRKLQRNGQQFAEAAGQQIKAAGGAGAIRDVLLGSQPTYLEIYRRADLPSANWQPKTTSSCFPSLWAGGPGHDGDCRAGRSVRTQRAAAPS